MCYARIFLQPKDTNSHQAILAYLGLGIIEDRHDDVQDTSDKATILPGGTDGGCCSIQDLVIIYMLSGHAESKTVLVTGARAFRNTEPKRGTLCHTMLG